MYKDGNPTKKQGIIMSHEYVAKKKKKRREEKAVRRERRMARSVMPVGVESVEW